MRGGPGINDLSDGLAWGVRASVIRGGRTLAEDIPLSGARLEWTLERTVPALLTFEAPLSWTPVWPLDPLNRFGQRVVPVVVCRNRAGVEWRTPLGQFLITDWQVGDSSVSVTAKDLMQLLEDDPMGWPSSPPSGARLSTELQRLSGQVPVSLDPGVYDGPVSPSAQWGNSRVESVWKLADSRSVGLRMGTDGSLHVYPLRDAAQVDAVYEALDLPGRVGNGLLINAPHATNGNERRPNRWIVTGTNSEGDKEKKFSATLTNTGFPYEPAGYGWVTSHNEFSAAASQQAVNEAADTYMRNDIYAVRSRSIEIVPDPRIEVGDIIGFSTREENVVGRVIAFSLPLSDVSQTMRVDINVLEW